MSPLLTLSWLSYLKLQSTLYSIPLCSVFIYVKCLAHNNVWYKFLYIIRIHEVVQVKRRVGCLNPTRRALETHRTWLHYWLLYASPSSPPPPPNSRIYIGLLRGHRLLASPRLSGIAEREGERVSRLPPEGLLGRWAERNPWIPSEVGVLNVAPPVLPPPGLP